MEFNDKGGIRLALNAGTGYGLGKNHQRDFHVL